MDRTIYILGTGSIGKLIAHSVRGLPNPPPVTLLLHRGSLWKEWSEGPKQITLTTNGVDVVHGGFEAEMARAGWRAHNRQISVEEFLAASGPDDIPKHLRRAYGMDDESLLDEAVNAPIRNLIVATKAPSTFSALNSIKHRLSANSCILFTQNGMGIQEEMSKRIFPDPASRPHYMQGIVSHGVHSNLPWEATHAGHGSIYISISPPHSEQTAPQTDLTRSNPGYVSARYILQTMLRSPVLAAVAVTPEVLLLNQLEKLAVNAVINPLTALIDARNGAILDNYHLERAVRLILAEVGLVIRNLPEIKDIELAQQRFVDSALYAKVVQVATNTADNISSMLADVRAGRRTEIEYINGYVVKRGEEIGVKCFMNYLMQQMVQGKRNTILRELSEAVPIIPHGKSTTFLELNKGMEDETIQRAETTRDDAIRIIKESS